MTLLFNLNNWILEILQNYQQKSKQISGSSICGANAYGCVCGRFCVHDCDDACVLDDGCGDGLNGARERAFADGCVCVRGRFCAGERVLADGHDDGCVGDGGSALLRACRSVFPV